MPCTSQRTKTFLLAFATVAGWLSQPAESMAGNTNEQLFGSHATMLAGAVVATVPDASAVVYNPAGLARMRWSTLDITTSAFVLRNFHVPDLLTAPIGANPDNSFSEFLNVPAALTFARPISDTISLGAGVFTAKQGNLNIKSSLPLTIDEEHLSTWRLEVRERSSTTHYGAGAGWRAHPALYVGMSLLLTQRVETSTEIQSGGYINEAQFETIAFDTQIYEYDFTSLDLSPLLGVQYTTGGLSVGASAQLGTLFLHDSEESWVLAEYATRFSSEEDTADDFGGDYDADYEIEEEEIRSEPLDYLGDSKLRVGVAYQWDGGMVAADLDMLYTLPGLANLREGTHLNLQLGTQWRLTPMLWLGAGVFTDRAIEEISGLIPGEYEVDLYGGTVSVRIGDERALATEESADIIGFDTTIGLRVAHGNGQIAGLRVPDDLGAEGGVFSYETAEVSLTEISLMLSSGLYF